jgi:hypothetical protein
MRAQNTIPLDGKEAGPVEIWHLATDTPRLPRHPSADEPIRLHVGTSPIAPGQAVWVEVRVRRVDGSEERSRAEGAWHANRGPNSYWEAPVGPFHHGDEVHYAVCGADVDGEASGGHFSFRVGPKIHLALLWHQHQPLYKDLCRKGQPGSYRFPRVRLHALRDYYGMAALLEEQPDVHVTINLTPVLLWQIEDYGVNVDPDARSWCEPTAQGVSSGASTPKIAGRQAISFRRAA